MNEKTDNNQCQFCDVGALMKTYERAGQGFWQGEYIEADDDEYLMIVACDVCGKVHAVVPVAMADVDRDEP